MRTATECVPLSDDDSVRATSAFSVRDSLKTDDEDPTLPISGINAKLLKHEYNLIKNSNFVLDNNGNSSKKHDVPFDKMDKIIEEKIKSDKVEVEPAKGREIATDKQNKAEVLKDIDTNKQKSKTNIDTASQSLGNPKSSTKSGSDVSVGLSKSVPPSYKQKLLQFSRDKLRFGSGGNKLTRSIKRSFHFSRSWDKNKNDNQRRTSEPNVNIASFVETGKEKCSKEEKDEDVEKCEIIDEVAEGKDVANNDNILMAEDNLNGKR